MTTVAQIHFRPRISPAGRRRGRSGPRSSGSPRHARRPRAVCGCARLRSLQRRLCHDASSDRDPVERPRPLPWKCDGDHDAWVTELQDALGADSVLLDPDVTAAYARDQAMLAPAGTPAAVVLPRSTADVVAVMQVATRHGVPVVPRGAGSGLAGASNAVDGAITLVMTRMDAVLEVAPADRLAVVQPGVVNKALRDAVAGSGLFYPPDPSSYDWCTIGGNLVHELRRPVLRQVRRHHRLRARAGGRPRRRAGAAHRPADGQGRRRATTWPGCSSARRARSASSPRRRWPCGRRRSGRSPWPPRSRRRRRPARSSSGWSPRAWCPACSRSWTRPASARSTTCSRPTSTAARAPCWSPSPTPAARPRRRRSPRSRRLCEEAGADFVHTTDDPAEGGPAAGGPPDGAAGAGAGSVGALLIDDVAVPRSRIAGVPRRLRRHRGRAAT